MAFWIRRKSSQVPTVSVSHDGRFRLDDNDMTIVIVNRSNRVDPI